ncbi:hypothetical protein DPEC_G00346210 [Dallia pectoralis]|uniref:Uncharacterized protein n=1 Tax=Dallia pectoralis TaxID=75939 RepID=A0ACC2F3P5_DALPE|nr:hypothetical protein DPEC_G00346210 [Dallia pectoralis]
MREKCGDRHVFYSHNRALDLEWEVDKATPSIPHHLIGYWVINEPPPEQTKISLGRETTGGSRDGDGGTWGIHGPALPSKAFEEQIKELRTRRNQLRHIDKPSMPSCSSLAAARFSDMHSDGMEMTGELREWASAAHCPGVTGTSTGLSVL